MSVFGITRKLPQNYLKLISIVLFQFSQIFRLGPDHFPQYNFHSVSSEYNCCTVMGNSLELSPCESSLKYSQILLAGRCKSISKKRH